MGKTTIEWVRKEDGSAGKTWGPVTGCDEASPGCDNCYAKSIAERFRGGKAFPNGFDVQLRPHKLTEPLSWRAPTHVFVNSMSDLFHPAIPDEYIAKVWGAMAWTPRHTYKILTKRHARMRSLLSSRAFKSLVDDAWFDPAFANHRGAEDDAGHPYDRWPLPNVWMGVSVEDQKWADIRIPALLEIPAAVRWISAEPLLGPIDLLGQLDESGTHRPRLTYWLDGRPHWGDPTPARPGGLPMSSLKIGPRLDWVVVGGESGPKARPMHPDWARLMRDQCQTAGVAFLFKQWGSWVTEEQSPEDIVLPGKATHFHDGAAPYYKVGKGAAGRVLDGRTWDQYPDVGRTEGKA